MMDVMGGDVSIDDDPRRAMLQRAAEVRLLSSQMMQFRHELQDTRMEFMRQIKLQRRLLLRLNNNIVRLSNRPALMSVPSLQRQLNQSSIRSEAGGRNSSQQEPTSGDQAQQRRHSNASATSGDGTRREESASTSRTFTEAGGTVTDVRGQPIDVTKPSSILASNEHVHRPMLDMLGPVIPTGY